MNITVQNNIFSENELMLINKIINDWNVVNVNHFLGRLEIELTLPGNMIEKITKLINNLYVTELSLSNVSYVEYSKIYGSPDLPPHFDGDSTDLIVNFQLNSNTNWNIGLDKELYSLNNNSALIFNPNKIIHWRPRKEFKDGESVEMIFFRFSKSSNPSNYSDLIYSQDHKVFTEIRAFRDSLV